MLAKSRLCAGLGALLLALPPPAFAGATNATMMTNASNAAQPFALNNLNGKVGMRFYAQAYSGAVSHAACTWNATHDDVDCINAAIAAAKAAGGGTVVVPAGTYGANRTLTLAPQVVIRGAGGGPYGECATTLTWIGSAGGVMAQGNSNSGSVTNLSNAGLGRMCLDGAGLAADGVDLWSVSYSRFERLYIQRVTTQGFYLNEAPISNAQVSGNLFNGVYIDLSDASAASAKGWVIGGGSATADANRNVWIGGYVLFQNNTGFECGAADSNHFYGMVVQTAALGVTGKSLDLLGSNVAALNACRENAWFGVAAGNNGIGGAYAEGTGSFTYPSNNNFFYDFKIGDAEPVPTVGAGATLGWIQTNGIVQGNAWTLNGVANLLLPNAAATGTTLNSLAKINNTSKAIITAVTDTQTAIGIVVGGAGTTGNASIATAGEAYCNFDGSTTSGHWVAMSSSVAGDCTDSATRPPFVVGKVATTNTGAGLYPVNLMVGMRGANVNAQNSLNPTGTTSSTAVMMGLAGSITPLVTGQTLLYLNGDMINNTAGDGAQVTLRYGTGSAPANGAASSGTLCAGPQRLVNTPSTTFRLPFGMTCLATLTAGTTYWIDAALAATTGGTATINGVAVGASEQ